MNWTDLFDMGAYNFHVWTSWGISLATMLAIVVIAKRRNAKIRSNITRQIKREERANTE